MSKPKFHRLPTILSLVAVVGMTSAIGANPARAGQVLRGGVSEQDRLRGGGDPSLSRHDIGNDNGDPFSNGDGMQQLDAPSLQVQTATAPAPPPRKAFPLNADQDGGDQFNPSMGNPMMDQMPRSQPPPQQVQQQMPPAFNPNDPDSSPEMQLAWDAWHKRVAEEVYRRFSTLSNAAFSHSRPLLASASYCVTRDGRILNARLMQPSSNLIFNTLVLGVINSLSGDYSVLAFPQGSRRMMVEKGGTFKQNCSTEEGYRFTTGDRETIAPSRAQQQQRQMANPMQMQQNQMQQLQMQLQQMQMRNH